MTMQLTSHPICALALLLAAAPHAMAGEAQVSLRTYAQDTGGPPDSDEHAVTERSRQPPAVSRAVASSLGHATANAQAAADGRTGEMHAAFDASVAGDGEVVGRGGTATGTVSLLGDIVIVGSGPAGAATFTAVLEGSYATRADSLNSTIAMDYSFRVGSSPEFNGHRDFSRGADTFSMPFTWTQTVRPGDVIGFDLFLRVTATAALGVSELDALDTFKVTGIQLPAGFDFTPDADGFLSQFNGAAPVPEPSSLLMSAVGLALLAGYPQRRFRSGHPASHG